MTHQPKRCRSYGLSLFALLTLVYPEKEKEDRKRKRGNLNVSFIFFFRCIYCFQSNFLFFWWDRYINYCINKKMEKDSLRASNNGATTSRSGGVDGLLRSSSEAARQTTTTTTSDFVPQWGNRKRLRCMKVQAKDDSAAAAQRTTARVDRRVVRADRELGQPGAATNSNHGNGYLNLRHRPCSPPMLPPQRVLR